MHAEPTPVPQRLPRVLWPMMFGNVVIGMGVMIAAGLLNDIHTALDVSITTAGQIISVSAVVMCLGAPLIAASVGRWDRRQLLIGSLVWYGAFHALAALAPGFDSLLGWRVLAMLAAAAYTPQAAACIGMLVPLEQRGRAITFVFLGWSVASVLGSPLGAWIGGTFGWRWSFALLAALSFVSALWLALRLPRKLVPPALSAAAWRQTLTSPALMLTLSITVLSAAGQFVLFSYMAPYVVQLHGATPTEFSLMLLAYGLCGFAGNAWLSRRIDHIGAERAMTSALVLIALGMALVSLAPRWGWLLLAILPWGLGVFASNSAQQARLVGIAPALASASVALNTSAMYMGQALGATLGGWLLLHQGMSVLPGVGSLGMLLAVAMSLWAAKMSRKHPVQAHP